eukprot:gene4657-5819_t
MQEVILHSLDFKSAEKELQDIQGVRITHQINDKLFICHVDDCSKLEQVKCSCLVSPSTTLDETSKLIVDSWNQMKGRGANICATTQPKAWDSEGHSYPRNPQNDPRLKELLDEYLAISTRVGVESTQSPDTTTEDKDEATLLAESVQRLRLGVNPPSTSLYLVGRVCIPIILVSGKSVNGSQDFTMSLAEQQKVLSQVFQTTDFLTREEPTGKLIFSIIVQTPNIVADPGTGGGYEGMEKVWRDPALNKMGWGTGTDGVYDLLVAALDGTNSKYGAVAFFTKYPCEHFAYQIWNRLIINYDNNGWGSDKLFQTFQHELLHAFGAADEYADSSCTVAKSGTNKIPNYNCENVSYNHIDCVMRTETTYMCGYTKGQSGWELWKRVTLSDNYVNFYDMSQGVVFNNKIYFVVVLGTKDGFLISSPDGENWNIQWSTPFVKNVYKCLGLAVFQNKLYFGYESNSYSGGIYMKSSSNAVDWTDITMPSGWDANTSIGMTEFKGNLILAYRGSGSKGIYIAGSPDGQSWSTFASPSGWDCDVGIGLQQMNGKLYIAYNGTGSGGIYVGVSDDAKSWSTIAKKSDWEASIGLGMVTMVDEFNYERLYFGYQGTGSFGVGLGVSIDATIWNSCLTIPYNNWSCNVAGTVVSFNGKIYTIYIRGSILYAGSSKYAYITN